jgi:hypothetical protein
MSEGLDGSAAGTADAAVAEAVAQAVREAGHRVSGEPRRVQGMVNDVLGEQSRTRRAEVDAVVLAAEESVPEDLLTGRVSVDEAVDRLRGRGLDDGVALFAIDVWRYALGMLGSSSQPPTLSNSLETTSQPAVTASAPDTSLGDELVWSEPAVVDTTVLPATSGGEAPETAAAGRSRPWWLIGAAAVALVAVAAALLVIITGGDDEPESVAMTRPS